MGFVLKNEHAKTTGIRLEIYVPGEKSRFKYNTGRSIKPEHWDKKTRRARIMRGEQCERNRKLNLILNEYELALERIRDLYGSALTKQKLKKTLDEYFHVETEVVEVITVKSLLTEFLKEKTSMESVTKATLTKYKMIRDKFVKFLGKQYLPIEALERPVLIKFITFLRTKYELTDNTLQRNYSYFKAR